LYGKFTSASENNIPVDDVDNELPSSFKLVSKHALGGVAPVVGEESKLTQAVKEHAHNFDLLAAARNPRFMMKDATVVTVEGKNFSIQDLGIGAATFEGLKKHKVAVYSVAGYYDSASVRSAARLHNYLATHGVDGQSKLTIGPWTHGARSCWSPSAQGTVPQFPLFQDVKRFFDCKLKGECDSISGEDPVHYFFSGEDVWRSEKGVWPPRGAVMKTMPLNTFEKVEGHESLTSSSSSMLQFKVKLNATSGAVSRWNLVFHLMKMAVTYPHLSLQHDASLTFTSQPLTEALKLIGSAHIVLSLAVNDDAADAAIFAYLEECDDSDGSSIHYITEGVIRVSHAVISSDHTHVGAFDNVKRSFTEVDSVKLVSGQHTSIEFAFEPMAYTIPAGHSLRVRLTGADADNFYLDNINGLASVWDIDTKNSAVYLPLFA
jgi:putative CocE/NonD family hydrolase